jgi:Ran GTPase-activating protein (RanGAP) involved in mRNA processing and transport
MKLSKDSWQAIADGVRVNTSIKYLALNAMALDPKALEILVPAFSENRTLETLDLSYNYMGDKVSSFLTKLISNQSERRDNVVWLHGLRGEVPKPKELQSGLQSLVLRYNSLKDFSACEISRVLTFDTYLKSIDLRNNLFKSKGIKEIVNVLNINTSILNIDL